MSLARLKTQGCSAKCMHETHTLDNDKLDATHIHGTQQDEDEPRRDDAQMAEDAYKGRKHEGVESIPMPEVRILAAPDPGPWQGISREGAIVKLHAK